MSGAFGHKYIKSHQHIWQKDYRSSVHKMTFMHTRKGFSQAQTKKFIGVFT